MYDDHMYCPTDDKHSAQCYCVTSYDLRLEGQAERDEFPPNGLCREHDIHGDPLD